MSEEKKQPPDETMYPFSEALPAVIREHMQGLERNFLTKFEAMEATHKVLQAQIDRAQCDDKDLRDLVNELRREMVKEEEMKTIVRTLTKEIDNLNRAKANLEGRFWAMGIFFAGFSVVLQFLSKYWRSG